MTSKPTSIIIKVPKAATYKWRFQRIVKWTQNCELRSSSFINNNKLLLCLSYAVLFAIGIARIVLYIFINLYYSDKINSNDKFSIFLECCISSGWLMYFIFCFSTKLRTRVNLYELSAAYFAHFLFCICYFTFSFYTLNIIWKHLPFGLFIVLLLLFIAYGFATEKAPNFLIIMICIIALSFLIEAVVRIFICRCESPCLNSKEVQFEKKSIPITQYKNQKEEQNRCSICLRDFEENERIVELRCHKAHVFHADCLNEWVKMNPYCPFCRLSITDNS